ncbi:hypothetical protein BU23DRAFT_567840 [Bimuria novae-zelandiae CBS 107.79]|uniref:Uncharacterized protein n=1 Tax=Bimuria novae-zelandiae CBS 107.79 TaxID=1447943 RepID=A0A6A5VCH6_9PLEO|nr:hypothetical protein BU23DRAFT_567840 [Bimuria novae-zelandiae CBS 107.79]
MRFSFKKSLAQIFGHYSEFQEFERRFVFGICDPESGGANIIIASSLRLDVANQGIFLDAAVVPLTATLFRDHTQLIPGIFNKITLAERCRTWEHTSTCEYIKTGQMPYSTEFAGQFLCKCSMDVFAKDFVSDLPAWRVLRKSAIRVATPFYYKSLFGTNEPSRPSSAPASRIKPPSSDEVERLAEIFMGKKAR